MLEAATDYLLLFSWLPFSVFCLLTELVDLFEKAGKPSYSLWKIDPATGELDKGSWYVTYLPTHPTHPELSQAGSLKQTHLVIYIFVI